MMCGEGESQAARHARFFSGGPDRARIDLPRPQTCETCGGTAPCPASATPRERAPRQVRMSTDIAELRTEVKNKVRTCPPLGVMAGPVPAITSSIGAKTWI